MRRPVATHFLSEKIRVACIIEAGKITPRWFDINDKPSIERVQIKEICYRWSHCEGAALILNYSVTDGKNNFRLSFNTTDYTWSAGIAIN